MMVLTKNQTRIMQAFVANITKRFSIRELSRLIRVDYSHVHRSIKPLIEHGLLTEDDKKYRLNYKENHQDLAYIEALRSKEFLAKPKNRTIKLLIKDVLKTLGDDFFVLLIFGSTVTEKKPGDLDILLIVDGLDKVNNREKILNNTISLSTLKVDINVISFESVYEMLATRDRANVMNETLNKHLILYGAETYYRMVNNARR